MIDTFAELFENSNIDLNIKPGSIITATVLDIGDDYVIVDVYLKAVSVDTLNYYPSYLEPLYHSGLMIHKSESYQY